VPSVSRTVLRVPTIENNLVVTAEHVQQAIRENRPDTYWNTPPPPRIPTPSSDQNRFRQGLDNPIQDSMSKLDIGPPPALPLERDLESQIENVPMVEVVRAEDREAEVEADRKDGRRNDGGVAKPKPKNCKAPQAAQEKATIASQTKVERLLKPITLIAKLQNGNHFIQINLTSLPSSTGVTDMCNM